MAYQQLLSRYRRTFVVYILLTSLAVLSLTFWHSRRIRYIGYALPTLDTEFLLIDVQCMQKLLLNERCATPVLLASKKDPSAAPFVRPHRSVATIATYYDDDNKDYLRFQIDDGDRAVLRYNTTKRTILLDSGLEVVALVPDCIPRFLKSWTRGRFSTCKSLLTRAENVTRYIPLSFANSVAEFRDLCEEHNVTCFLFGGSLLGWYRECSIIPHTWDFDFAMRRIEHSEKLIQAFIDSKVFRLKWILGRLNDSLELTVIKEGQAVDLFYLYEDAARGMDYTAGMNEAARQQLRWYQPKMQGVCTGDLLDKLVFVPCNTVDVFRATYGDKWMEDHPSGQYDWLNSPKNVEFGPIYSSTEWPLVMRRYDH